MVALDEHSDSKSESQFSLGKSQQILSRGRLQGSTGMHLNVVQEMCLLTKGSSTNRENFSTTGNLHHKVKESQKSPNGCFVLHAPKLQAAVERDAETH